MFTIIKGGLILLLFIVFMALLIYCVIIAAAEDDGIDIPFTDADIAEIRSDYACYEGEEIDS